MRLFGRQVSLDIELSAWVSSGPRVGSQSGVLQRKAHTLPSVGLQTEGKARTSALSTM